MGTACTGWSAQHAFKIPRSHDSPDHGGPAVRLTIASDGQALTALGATGIDDGTAPTGLHAYEKAVGAGTAGLGSLIGAFHGAVLAVQKKEKTCAGVRECRTQNDCILDTTRHLRNHRPLSDQAFGKPTIRPKTPF